MNTHFLLIDITTNFIKYFIQPTIKINLDTMIIVYNTYYINISRYNKKITS